MIGRLRSSLREARTEKRRTHRFQLSLEPLEGRALLADGAPVFTTGDVLVGVTGGVQWYRPDGSLVATVPLAPGQYTTGMALDAAGNLLATGFATNQIDRIAPTGERLGTFGGGFDKNPTSIVFDAAGYAYVGQSDGNHQVLKFDPAGNLVDSYPVQLESRGSGWIELAADQRTLYYTSEGHTVKRYDVVARQQLPDFATGLPGDDANQLQLLPDGGVLLADQQAIVRLDAAGRVVQTYSPAPGNDWFNLVLDPDGTSFWSSEYKTGRVARFDLDTGQVLQSFIADAGGVFGLAVVGGPRAATLAALSLSVVDATPQTTVGQAAAYTVRIANGGPGTARQAQVAFALPAGASFLAGSSTAGPAPVVQAGVVTFPLGDLAGGAWATATLVLAPAAPGLLTTQATAATIGPNAPGTATRVLLTTHVNDPAPVTHVNDPAPVVTATFLAHPAPSDCCRTTAVIIRFSQPLDPARAQDPRNYELTGLLPLRPGRPGRVRNIAIRRVRYDPAAQEVTLLTRQPLLGRWIYQLTIHAGGGSGVLSKTGIALAGNGRQAGTDYAVRLLPLKR